MKRFLRVTILLIVLTASFLVTGRKVKASSASLTFKHENFEENKITTGIYVDTGGQSVSGITADFTYPKDKLKVLSIETDNSLCNNFIEKEVVKAGRINLSCFTIKGMNGQGDIATIKFQTKDTGKALLKFTSDAAIVDSETTKNILSKPETATYTINEDLSVLPQTGETQTYVAFGFVLLVLLVMLILFILTGFSVWGGMYFSLGKWKVSGKYEVEKQKKEAKAKKKKNKSKKK